MTTTSDLGVRKSRVTPVGLVEPAGPLIETVVQAFHRQGYLAGVPVFEGRELSNMCRSLRAHPDVAGLDWDKGKAVTSRLFFELATHPRVVSRVGELLGPNVMLWGASLVVRRAGQVHAWHTDYETANPDGRCVSVWLGLRHVSAKSALGVISRSHLLGVAVRDAQLETGRANMSADELLGWAQRRDPRCELVQVPCRAGEAIFFDGRLWHGSDNGNLMATRVAALLQFATPQTPIRVPDFSTKAWPPRFYDHPRPATIMIHGNDSDTANRTVPPPAPLAQGAAAATLTSLVRPIGLPLPHAVEKGWSYHHQFRGATSNLRDLECHASVLSPGKTPHAPHRHVEEEVLVVLDGQATLMVDDGAGAVRPRPAPAGSLIYYPKNHAHTIANESIGPVTYLMFKWAADDAPTGAKAIPLQFFDAGVAAGSSAAGGDAFRMKLLFEGPTEHLTTLHAHLSVLQPGGGYAAHVDAHDVVILVLEGTVRTLGQTVGPNGLIFCAAGEPHGMSNDTGEVARYLVLEFHGRNASWKRAGNPIPQQASRWGGYTLAGVKKMAKRALGRK